MTLRLSLPVLFAALLLIGCGPKTLNPEGKAFFKEHNPQYQLADLKASCNNEAKSVETGHMPQTKVAEYLQGQVETKLAETNHGQTPVGLNVIVSYSRVFSWGGSSLASIQYTADVILVNADKILGSYQVTGNVADRSIMGDFKTAFGANKPKDENPLFDFIAQQIVEGLPKK